MISSSWSHKNPITQFCKERKESSEELSHFSWSRPRAGRKDGGLVCTKAFFPLPAVRPGPSSFLSLAHPLLWDRGLHSLSGMLRDSRRLSGRTRANPRPAQTQHLRLGSLVAVAGAFPAAHYRPSAWWLGGGRVSWGWEVVQLPVSALAAEPWPPDALPLSVHPRSRSKPPHHCGLLAPRPPSPPISPTATWGTGRRAWESAVAPSLPPPSSLWDCTSLLGFSLLQGGEVRGMCVPVSRTLPWEIWAQQVKSQTWAPVSSPVE